MLFVLVEVIVCEVVLVCVLLCDVDVLLCECLCVEFGGFDCVVVCE